MQPMKTLTTLWAIGATMTVCAAQGVGDTGVDGAIVCPAGASAKLKLSAKEVRRYVYLRSGTLLPLTETPRAGASIVLKTDAQLREQQYRLRTDVAVLTISGGSDVAVLYGAYAFAEKLGVRFYLHGDVAPDEQIPFKLPVLDETREPLFALRGVNPWGSHPFGFDAWSTDYYKAIFTQLTKLRMNFLGIHCYPEGHPYAEPTVWHGLAGDFDPQGRVRSSYVSRYFNTLLTPAWGDYLPKKTSDYHFGAALLFEREDWAPPVLEGYCPLPQTPAACNEVFDRMGAQFHDAFTFARHLGVRTCIGTEAPLTLPRTLAQRTSDVRAVYEGTFRRIMASHPLDYYWIWTPESWTWEGNQPAQYSNTVADLKLALEAWQNVKAPFQLATAGWVLGPAHDRAAFDRDLPKDIPMSAISRDTGATEVDPAFGGIRGREKWAIPWLESDNRQGLAAIQLEAGRMRRDAAAALAAGCTGLMGLHWRTEILSPNVSALAQAAWDQAGWNPRPGGAAGELVPTIEGPVGGNIASYPGREIAKAADAAIYRTCRYAMEGYNLKLPNGRYRVTLKFCEPHFDSAGKRVGDFKLQGKTVLQDLDIFARVGKFAALDFAFDDIEVTDGWLRLGVEARTSLPCISAIVIEGPAATRKINCGGPAYQDFEADDRVAASEKQRGLPCDDFYADWARANFGEAEIGRVFAAVDGRVPQVTDGGCPAGSLTPVKAPWSTMVPQFAFVDELEKFRPSVHGAGNLDRFDYWLNSFRYHRSLAQIRCALADPDPTELMRLWTETYRFLLATVNSPGALAMVVNMENHPGWAAAVAKRAPQPWPKEYQGAPRLIVPCVRSVLEQGETLNVTLIALDQQPVRSVALRVRSLGHGPWKTIAAQHVARAVWQAQLPAFPDDFEYCAEAQTQGGQTCRWPATAPELNQTVVIFP